MNRTRSQTKAVKRNGVDDSESTRTEATVSSSKITFRARKIPKLAVAVTVTATAKPDRKPSTAAPIAKPLTSEGELEAALKHLRNADPLLAPCIDSFNPPEFSTDRKPFYSLTRSIISQQLSNKAAKAIQSRFDSLCGGLESVLPDVVLSLSAQQLRHVGVSAPKASYLHDLASKFAGGVLSDSSVLLMDDDTLREKLTSVKGIGPWSVHMFMIFTLHRPDVLPVGDLVVRRGVERLYGLKALPRPSEMERLCEKWKPYRSLGALYMYRLADAKGVVPIATATQQ